MIWFAIEAGLALALLIFIVWFTFPRSKKQTRRADDHRNEDES